MRRVIAGLGATAAATCCLAAATPALADYAGAGAAPASKFPPTTAEAPAPTPVVPLFVIGTGVILVGAGGLTLARRRA